MQIFKIIKTVFKQILLIMFAVIALVSFMKMNSPLKSKKQWQSAVNNILTADNGILNRGNLFLFSEELATKKTNFVFPEDEQSLKITLASLENRFFAEVPKHYDHFQKKNEVLVQRQTYALLNEVNKFFAKNTNFSSEKFSFYKNIKQTIP